MGRMAIERVTIRSVAERAGVSPATVSLVLNQRPGVRISTATRERVLRVAGELGYAPNRIARSLAHGRTQLIGVIVPDLSNAFYADIVDGIEAAAAERQLHVLLAHSRDDAATEQRQVRLLMEQQVDGLVCMVADGTAAHCREWLPAAMAQGLACVIVDELDPGVAVDCIASDDELGARLATAHLLARGHRRIALLAAGQGRSSARARLRGWRLALAEAGIAEDPALVAGTSYRTDQAVEAVERLLAQRPEAMLACSDQLAAVLIDRVGHAGLAIPRDVAVVGYANDRYLAPALGLTTVDQASRQIGRQALELLSQRMDAPDMPPARILLPPSLVLRRTA